MLQFVILEHDHPYLHWDLMLECGELLRTWRLASPLRYGETISAVAVPDHRRLYLDYEGSISGGRGRVARREQGTFTGNVRGSERIVVRLFGEHLQGSLHLEHTEGENWRVHFERETESFRTEDADPPPT